MNIFLLELKIMLHRIEFKIIMILTVLLTISAFILNASFNFGQDISTIGTAYDAWIGMSGRIFRGILLFTIPIIGAIPYSDNYYINNNGGFNNQVFIRMEKSKYIIINGIIVFLSGFIPIFLALLINQAICLISYPIDNMFNPLYFLQYDTESLFYPINMNLPYLYNFIYMMIVSLFSGVFALLSYGISFVYKKSRIAIVTIPFLIYIISDFIFSAFGFVNYSLYYNLNAGNFSKSNINEYYYPIILFILIFLSVAMIISKMRSDDI